MLFSPKNKHHRIRNAFRLARHAFADYTKNVLILLSLGFASGLLEGVGVNVLIPILSFFTGNENTGTDFISKTIKQLFEFFHIDFSLPYLLILISGLFLLKSFVQLILNYVRVSMVSDYERRVRSKLFEDTLKADWTYLMKQKLGYLETVLMNDISQSANMLDAVVGTFLSFASLSMYLVVALNISAPITLTALAVGVTLFFIFKPFFYRVRAYSHKIAELRKEVANHVDEHVLGVKLVKSLRVERAVWEQGNAHFAALCRYRIKTFLYQSVATGFLQPISVIFLSVMLYVSYTYFPDQFNFAALAAIVYLVSRIFTYSERLQQAIYYVNSLVPYVQSVLTYQGRANQHFEIAEGSELFFYSENLTFRHVSFSYENKRTVLDGVNFSIQKGEMVGIIGLSGAGKTTIFDLVLRLFKPDDGTIKLDGTDIQAIDLSSWRKSVIYVPQEVFLMNGTIAENIRFYDHTISDRDVREAARLAYASDFINALPHKFKTHVGERGMNLSAGQRQRIAIARALARKPEILLLDEATSALDNESEVAIEQAIDKLKGKVTILVIAHRLGTVRNADRLLVLEKGKIKEDGTPTELLRDKHSYFYRAYNIRH